MIQPEHIIMIVTALSQIWILKKIHDAQNEHNGGDNE